MATLLDQLYKTKLQLIAVLIGVVGIAMMILAKWPPLVTSLEAFPFPVPLAELGSGVFTGGLLGVLFGYFDRKYFEQRIRTAFLDSLAFNPETLKGLVSNETLDRIAASALGLQLSDHALAQDIYTDVRDQIIRAPERWRDFDISVTLGPWLDGPVSGPGSMFEMTLRTEYRVRPANTVIRFACVSDLDEYRELLRDPTVTAPWYVGQSGGVDAASRQTFELLQLSVNGQPRKLRRTQQVGSQLYTASLGQAATSDEEVTIAYTYRILIQRLGHLLYLDVSRPTKGLHVKIDYSGAGIRRMNTVDFIASAEAPRVEYAPSSTSAKTVDIGFDGWVFPRSGVAFSWVLEDEFSSSRGQA